MDLTEVSSYKRKKNSYNIWRETIKFFNTKVNQEVTRQQLLGNIKRFGRHNMDSRDTYRLLLQRAGFLKSVGRGRYQVIKPIPDISLTLMEEFASQDKPMGWLKFWSGLDYYLEYRRRNGKGRVGHNKSS